MRHFIIAGLLALAHAASLAAPPTAQNDLNGLQAALQALTQRIERLEQLGRPAAESVPGAYRLHGLQTELNGGPGSARTTIYTYEGSVTFSADGTYRVKGTSTGSSLVWDLCCVPGAAQRSPRVDEPEKDRGHWTLEGNRLTLKNAHGRFVYSGAGDLFVGASSNTEDGTSVILLMVREP
jgi:hypothetical protein